VTVELREELGSEVDLHCAVGVAPLHLPEAAPTADPPGAPAGPVPSALAATIVARMDPRCTLQVGERARVQVDLAALHFFDPETGASLRG
jgi:multiple sugar transport system ATP-binding protein